MEGLRPQHREGIPPRSPYETGPAKAPERRPHSKTEATDIITAKPFETKSDRLAGVEIEFAGLKEENESESATEAGSLIIDQTKLQEAHAQEASKEQKINALRAQIEFGVFDIPTSKELDPFSPNTTFEEKNIGITDSVWLIKRDNDKLNEAVDAFEPEKKNAWNAAKERTSGGIQSYEYEPPPIQERPQL